MKAVKYFMGAVVGIQAIAFVQILIMKKGQAQIGILLLSFVLATVFWLAVALTVRKIVILIRNIHGRKSSREDDSFAEAEAEEAPAEQEQPALQAVGLLDHQYCKGQWTLDWDGVLHYQGCDVLDINGGADTHRSKVKKIVIDGFWYVGPHVFENFVQCEEVVFNRAFVQIGERAFAHCRRLKTVTFAGDYEAADDAFLDTPYQASIERIEYIPEDERDGILSSGEWGAKFIRCIREETELMKTMSSPKALSGFGRWTPDDHDWFASCIEILDNGAEAGEAAMLYLAAELKTFEAPLYINDMEVFCLNKTLWLSGENIVKLYIDSAEKGFPHAMLWCAYCLSQGIHGFEQDKKKSGELLDELKKSENSPLTIAIPDLRFLENEVDDIVELAYDADREEDIIGDRYNFNIEEYRNLLPNPEWGTLHLRTIELVTFMVSLGLPYVLSKRGYDYQWDGDFDEFAGNVRKVKTDWLSWCTEQDFAMTME